jgi:hypothetical protein
MRTLTIDEAQWVAGGDEETDYNELACTTAALAGIAATGFTYGAEAATASGVASPVASELCQSATTAIGDALGAAAAGVVESVDELIVETDDALGQLEMAFRQATVGL